jgi:hypothetical protein
MRFLSLVKAPERTTPPSQDEMDRMENLITEGMKVGWLLHTEGLLPTSLGARVRSTNGKVTVTDGPFSESKEVVGGFAIFQAESKAEAIQLIKKFFAAGGDGECELRQLYEMPPQ